MSHQSHQFGLRHMQLERCHGLFPGHLPLVRALGSQHEEEGEDHCLSVA